MAFKIYTSGNNFYVENTEINKIYQGKKEDIEIENNFVDTELFVIRNMPQLPIRFKKIHFDDILDDKGNPYPSALDFKNWYENNIGLNSTLGGANALDIVTDKGWLKSGLVQFSQTPGKTLQFYTSGLTFKKLNDDGTKTTVTIPETDGITFDNINPFTGATVNGVQGVATFDVNDINNGFIYSDATTTAAVTAGDEMLMTLLYDFTNSRFLLVLPFESKSSPQNVFGNQTRNILGALDNLTDDILPLAWVVTSQSAGNYYTNGASGVYNYDKLPLSNI